MNKSKERKFLILFATITLLIVLLDITYADTIKYISCGNYKGIPYGLPGFIRGIIALIRILVPILIILIGSIDFLKVIFGGKQEDLPNAIKKFVPRLISGAAVFFIILLVQLLIKMISVNTNGILACVSCFTTDEGQCNVYEVEKEDYTKEKEDAEEARKKLAEKREEIRKKNEEKAEKLKAALKGLPQDDSLYPLDSKDIYGNKLAYIEIDGKHLTEAEMQEIDNQIWTAVNAQEDWGARVAAAAYSLIFGLSQKGLKIHYHWNSWRIPKTASVSGKTGGYIRAWGNYLTKPYCDTGAVNIPGDCKNKPKHYYIGLDCTAFVYWAWLTGCGNTPGTMSQVYSSYPDTINFDLGRPGDYLDGPSHAMLFLKRNNDGTYMVAEASRSKSNGVYIHKYSKKDLLSSGWVLVPLSSYYQQKCKKT